MKKILFLVVILFTTFFLDAQETTKGIQFIDNEPWEKVVGLAQKQHKPIFVDCYTSWCGPCKKLAREVFTREDVGQYVNHQFVAVKYDVEKGTGLAFAQKYRDQIKAFPTLLLIRTDGTIMQKIVGAYPAEEILSGIRNGVEGKTWKTLEKEYLAGKRDYDFITEYLDMLLLSDESQKYEEVKRSYVKQFPVDSLLNPQIWELRKAYIDHPQTEEYQFLLNHIDEFANRGFNRYDLEWTLCIESYYQLSALIERSFKTTDPDTLQQIGADLQVLKEFHDKPVKGFPEQLACIRIAESYVTGDVQELFYRLIYLGENHLVSNLDWTKAWAGYLIDHLTSREQIGRCVDYLIRQQQADEKKNSDWIVNNCYDTIAKGYEKLGRKEKAEACRRQSEAIEKRNQEKLKMF